MVQRQVLHVWSKTCLTQNGYKGQKRDKLKPISEFTLSRKMN